MPIDPKRIVQWLAGALAVASLFAKTSAWALDDRERVVTAKHWICARFGSTEEDGISNNVMTQSPVLSQAICAIRSERSKQA